MFRGKSSRPSIQLLAVLSLFLPTAALGGPPVVVRTSWVSVTRRQRRLLLVGNSFEEVGMAIQFYGCSIDCVADGNTVRRGLGFINHGMNSGIPTSQKRSYSASRAPKDSRRGTWFAGNDH